MKSLPQTEETLLLRTDFSDEAAWKAICSAVRMPDAELDKALGFFAVVNKAMGQSLGKPEMSVHIVDDPDYTDVATDQLPELLPKRSGQSFLFVVDRVAVSHPDHPILVVDLFIEPGRTFRAVPSQAFAIESNLSLANMSWEDFAGNVDDEGVFRGFSE